MNTVLYSPSPISEYSALPISQPVDMTVLIVNYNTAHLLLPLFEALEASRGTLKLKIVVIDNASTDGSVEMLRAKFPSAELIANSVNVGFGRANNQALSRVTGRYVLLLNTDAFVASDTLSKTVAFMDSDPRCGILGVMLQAPDGTRQPSCRYFPTPWNGFLRATGFSRFFPRTRLVDDLTWDHDAIRECDWVPGCYYLIRREVIDQLGLFDPRFFLYGEDVDHCRMVRRAGWKVTFYPFTKVMHMGGESAPAEAQMTRSGRQISALQIESELLYFRKHHGLAGVIAAVSLGMLSDFISASAALLRHRDMLRIRIALRHTAAMLRTVVRTRLGSRATR